jgi:hypothetical protein
MNAALIEILNQVKVYHWLSKDYNLHIILDQLYTTMSTLLDRYIEARISAGEKEEGPLVFRLVTDASINNVLSAITRMYNTIIGLRKDCSVYEQCLILDDMLEAFGKAKYLGSMLGKH